jgi:hypothetical protein
MYPEFWRRKDDIRRGIWKTMRIHRQFKFDDIEWYKSIEVKLYSPEKRSVAADIILPIIEDHFNSHYPDIVNVEKETNCIIFTWKRCNQQREKDIYPDYEDQSVKCKYCIRMRYYSRRYGNLFMDKESELKETINKCINSVIGKCVKRKVECIYNFHNEVL